MKRVLWVLLVACGLGACGGQDNTLKGSMSQVYSLKFDRVAILRVGLPGKEEVSIEYLRMDGQQVGAKVAKLTVQVGDLANLAGNEIDLLEKGPNGLPRGTLQRIEASTTDFPLKQASVQFDQEPTVGTNLSGQFHTTVTTDLADRSLNGEFKATVEAR